MFTHVVYDLLARDEEGTLLLAPQFLVVLHHPSTFKEVRNRLWFDYWLVLIDALSGVFVGIDARVHAIIEAEVLDEFDYLLTYAYESTSF